MTEVGRTLYETFRSSLFTIKRNQQYKRNVRANNDAGNLWNIFVTRIGGSAECDIDIFIQDYVNITGPNNL